MIRKPKQMSESMILGVVLTLAGGFQDAYSYNCRGQVFANAQTGNIVLLGQNIASGNFQNALHYLFPLLAFLAGVYLSEWVRELCKSFQKLHWRQIVLAFEIVMLAIAGLLPQSLNVVSNAVSYTHLLAHETRQCRWTAFGSSGASHAPPPCALAICAAALSFYADTISPRTRS